MESKKGKKANLETFRISIFLVGLIIAGAASAMALEFTGADSNQKVTEIIQTDDDLKLDFEVQETEPEPESEPEPEPEIDTPPPVDLDSLVESIDTSLVAKNVEIGTGYTPPPPVVGKKKEPKKLEPMDFPQQEAMFPGGMEGMYKWLGNEISYPKMARDGGIQGKVFVEFVIGVNGQVTSAKILRGIGGGCDEEALRVIKMMPNWTSAEQAGNKVPQRFRLPVFFRLQ